MRAVRNIFNRQTLAPAIPICVAEITGFTLRKKSSRAALHRLRFARSCFAHSRRPIRHTVAYRACSPQGEGTQTRCRIALLFYAAIFFTRDCRPTSPAGLLYLLQAKDTGAGGMFYKKLFHGTSRAPSPTRFAVYQSKTKRRKKAVCQTKVFCQTRTNAKQAICQTKAFC